MVVDTWRVSGVDVVLFALAVRDVTDCLGV